MAEVVLFHHVQGLTPGVVALADSWRAAGHTVHTPDLYGGRTFATIAEGAAFAEEEGERDLVAAADGAVAVLPLHLVHAGISSGVMHAQRFAQTCTGAVGALLMEACVPITGEWAFGPWPAGVPVQIHGMDDDAFFAHEGDVDAARHLVATTPGAELFLYEGDRHLFVDSSLDSHDADATALLVERTTAFLDRVGRSS